MLLDGSSLKGPRANVGDKVLARASTLLVGRAALETAEGMYPRAPNPVPSSRANAAAASLRRHVLPKDLPVAWFPGGSRPDDPE
jgi:hypothetical protein